MFQAAYTRLWAFRTRTRIALTSHIRDNAGFFVVQRRREALAKIPLRQQADSLEREPFRPQGHGEKSVPSLSSMFLLLRAGYELVESSTRLYRSSILPSSPSAPLEHIPRVPGLSRSRNQGRLDPHRFGRPI